MFESWGLRGLTVTSHITLKIIYSFSVGSGARKFIYLPGLRERGLGLNLLFWLMEFFVHD